MLLNEILTSISQKRPELDRESVRAVATDVLYSGEAESVLADDQVIDRLIQSFKSRQESSVGKVNADDPSTCPICRTALKPVRLADDREAVYCAKHFVVFPAMPKEKKED